MSPPTTFPLTQVTVPKPVSASLKVKQTLQNGMQWFSKEAELLPETV